MRRRLNEYTNITKIPDVCDQCKIMEEEIDNYNMKCPFCGETRRTEFDDYAKPYNDITGVEKSTWRWYREFSFLDLFRKSSHWKINSYKCHACGANWESVPFIYHV